MNIEMGQEAGPYIVSMFIHFSVQLFATPWTVVFSVYEILHARILDLVTCSSPGDLPTPGIKSSSPASRTLQADSLPSQPHGKPYIEDRANIPRVFISSACYLLCGLVKLKQNK